MGPASPLISGMARVSEERWLPKCLSVLSQEQYIFCYDALAEAITVGNTEIEAQDYQHTMSKWYPDPDSTTCVLRKQFEVSALIHVCFSISISYRFSIS